MKKIIIATVFIASSLCIYAQEPMGGGGFGGGRPPMGNFDEEDEDQATEVVKFPEIPNLTDKQREKVISEIVKEHDAIAKLEKQKQTLFAKYMKDDKKNGQHPQGRPNHAQGDSIHGKMQGMPENGQHPEGDSIHGKVEPRPEGQMAPNGQRPGGPQMQPPKMSEKDQKSLDKIKKNEGKVYAKADKKYSSILTKEQYAVFKEKKKEIQFNSPNSNKQHQRNHQQRMNGDDDGPGMPMGGGNSGGGDF